MSGDADGGKLELDPGDLSEAALPSRAVVGMFCPVRDRVVQLCAGTLRAGVRDVALQQCPERFHGCVVADGGDSTHGALVPACFEDRLEAAQ